MDEGADPRPAKVFICYRREDTGDAARALRESVDREFGEGTAFLDERSIPTGQEWPRELQQALLASRIVVVLIGPQWLTLKSAKGRVRIEVKNDWVRREVETTLEADKPLLPLLVDGATPLDAEQLPESIEALAKKQAEAFELGNAKPHIERIRALLEQPVDTLGRYREHLRACHRNLVSFFPAAPDTVLEEVYVELALDPLRDVEDRTRTRARHADLETASEIRTLRALLEQPTDEDFTGRYVVQGEPGAGKSTLSRYLTWQLANQSDPAAPIPVFVPLATWSTTDGALLDLADPGESRQSHRDSLCDRLESLAGKDGRPGSVWIFLDGLDEVAPDRLPSLRSRIQTVVSDLPHARFVVTTRQIGYTPLGSGWLHARLRPLDSRKQRELLGRWLPDGRANDLHKTLAHHPEVATLAGNPLLLTLIAELAREDASRQVPRTRTRLYEDTIGLLLRKSYSDGATSPIAHPDDALRILTRLAFALQSDPRVAWPRDALFDTLDELQEQDRKLTRRLAQYEGIGDFLDQVEKRTGILAPHDGPNSPWKFLHRQFREYLSARHVSADRAAFLRLVESLEQDALPRWSETIGMACGLADDPLAMVRALATVSPAAAVKSLGEIEGATPAQLLDVLHSIPTDPLEVEPVWDGDDLRDAVESWNRRALATEAELQDLLMHHLRPVTDRATRIRAAWIHFALAALAPVDHTAFFTACGVDPSLPARHEFVAIPSGEFRMGSPTDEVGRTEAEGPLRDVTIEGFELSKYAVTNDQYGRFAGDHEAESFGGRFAESEVGSHPVVNVSWWESYLYCAWSGCRLPTESEWEYACRAGTEGPFSFEGDLSPDRVNYDGNYPYAGGAKGEYRERTVAVGELAPNGWGLHEMHGNVWEWCEDRWHESYAGAPEDGSAWLSRSDRMRVLRGGSWYAGGRNCRSADRGRVAPGDASRYVGFRPARSCHRTPGPLGP